MLNLLFWITAELLLLAALGRATEAYRNRTAIKLVSLPGLVLEGVLRLVSCRLSSTRVTGVDLLADGKPFVASGGSRARLLGRGAFMIVWLGGFYAAFHLTVSGLAAAPAHAVALPDVDPERISRGVVEIDLRDYARGVGALIASPVWTVWPIWVVFWVFAGAAPYFAVGRRELVAGALVLLLATLVTLTLAYLGIAPGFLSRGWYLRYWVLPDSFRIYSLFVTLLAVTLALHLAVKLAIGATLAVARRVTRRQP